MTDSAILECEVVCGNPSLPLFSGEIQCEALCMAVDVTATTSGKAESIKHTSELGELTCTQPFPSEPVMFWGDVDGEKYRSSYFERFGNKI
jgi:acetoacetyl-CoA synthetase